MKERQIIILILGIIALLINLYNTANIMKDKRIKQETEMIQSL